MNYGTTIRKITQPHISINNMFPPINAHSRPPSEDLRGVGSGGVADIHSASKHQQIRRQQLAMDQPNRSPLRIIYRSSDYSWNDPLNNGNVNNQASRTASPIKPKFSASSRQLANGILHDNTSNSIAHPSSSLSPNMNHHNIKDDTTSGDMHLSSAAKSLRTSRMQRTNSHLDKSQAVNAYGLPVRSESYRSSRLDYGMRSRHTSSKQRHYVNSKTSFHEINAADFPINGAQDENTYYHQPQINVMSSTQRLNGSTFDLTTTRKMVSQNKSNTFNYPANAAGHHGYYNSTQEIHRSETMNEKNNLTRFATRATLSKEPTITPQKFRQTSSIQTITVPAGSTVPPTNNQALLLQPGERHPSAQSYKSRDPNISYAYTDVKKYIEENDLMSSEKEQSIRNWIMDVEKHRHQQQKID